MLIDEYPVHAVLQQLLPISGASLSPISRQFTLNPTLGAIFLASPISSYTTDESPPAPVPRKSGNPSTAFVHLIGRCSNTTAPAGHWRTHSPHMRQESSTTNSLFFHLQRAEGTYIHTISAERTFLRIKIQKFHVPLPPQMIFFPVNMSNSFSALASASPSR